MKVASLLGRSAARTTPQLGRPRLPNDTMRLPQSRPSMPGRQPSFVTHNALSVGETRDRFHDLIPEVLLPSQFADARRNSHARPPEVRLVIAILEDAVRCYFRYLNGTRQRARRLFGETNDWFIADDLDEPFSFVSICTILAIDAEAFRAGLQRQALQRQTAGRTAVRSSPLQTRRMGGDRHLVTASYAPPQRAAGTA